MLLLKEMAMPESRPDRSSLEVSGTASIFSAQMTGNLWADLTAIIGALPC